MQKDKELFDSMRNIVILNSLHFSYPLPILMRVSYNTLIVKQNTSDYYKYTKTNLKFGPVSEKGRKRGSKGESLFYNVDKFSITLPSRVGRGIEKWIILSIHVKNSILWQRIKKWR